MNIKISPGTPKGKVIAPPSKSQAHRLLICAGLAKGKSVIANVSLSRDILATLHSLEALGVTYTIEGNTVTVEGCGGNPSPVSTLPCDESGSTLRFLLPLALLSGKETVLSGSPRLIERGVGIYQEVFAKNPIDISIGENQIIVKGQITPAHFQIFGGVSSQFISGLMFALPLLKKDSTLTVLPPVESRSYIDMTVEALKCFGVSVTETAPNSFFIKGGQSYQPQTLSVEGDWSNAAFLLALAELSGEVQVEGLSQTTLQGDAIFPQYLLALKEKNAVLDISNCPDLAPILFAMSAFFGSGATFLGTKRLKIKESDRSAAMQGELSKMGCDLEIGENFVKVPPAILTSPKTPLCGHNDHRIVMALSVLLTRLGGEITEAEAVSKSYPDFFMILKTLGIEVQDVTFAK